MAGPGDPTARRCEQCRGAMPNKTHRSRNSDGHLICEECKSMPQPNWNTAYSALSEPMKHEMRRREAAALSSVLRIAREGSRKEAIGFYDGPHTDSVGKPIGVYDKVTTPDGRTAEVASVYPDVPYYEGRTVQVEFEGSPGFGAYGDPGNAERDYERFKPSDLTVTWSHPDSPKTARLRRQAHDGGDGVTLFHCPFCGSGAISAGGDGTVTCDFCHTAFSVQVQPANAGMPQTIDGQPVDMPGMPQGEDLMLDNPDDPSLVPPQVRPDSSPPAPGAAPDGPLGGGADPAGAPAGGGDNPFAKKDDAPKKPKGDNPFAKGSAKTSTGAVVPFDDYANHLALKYATPAETPAVLDAVRRSRS